MTIQKEILEGDLPNLIDSVVLKMIRQYYDLKLSDISEHMGIKPQYLSDMESNRRPLNIERKKEYIDALKTLVNVTPKEILEFHRLYLIVSRMHKEREFKKYFGTA